MRTYQSRINNKGRIRGWLRMTAIIAMVAVLIYIHW